MWTSPVFVTTAGSTRTDNAFVLVPCGVITRTVTVLPGVTLGTANLSCVSLVPGRKAESETWTPPKLTRVRPSCRGLKFWPISVIVSPTWRSPVGDRLVSTGGPDVVGVSGGLPTDASSAMMALIPSTTSFAHAAVINWPGWTCWSGLIAIVPPQEFNAKFA